jgi:hypothetical protein
MVLVLVAASSAAIIAIVRGGSLKSLAATDLRHPWIVFAALVIQIIPDVASPDSFPRAVGVGALVISYGAVALFMLLNRNLAGMLVAAAGFSLNALVIGLNGAMPVSTWAADIAGIEGLADVGVKHELAGPHTVLGFLGDVIPIPATLQILSIGDVILATGLSLLVYKRTLADPAELKKPSD